MSGAPLNRARSCLSQMRRDIRGTPPCRHGRAPVARPRWLMRATQSVPSVDLASSPDERRAAQSCPLTPKPDAPRYPGYTRMSPMGASARGAIPWLAHAGYAIGSKRCIKRLTFCINLLLGHDWRPLDQYRMSMLSCASGCKPLRRDRRTSIWWTRVRSNRRRGALHGAGGLHRFSVEALTRMRLCGWRARFHDLNANTTTKGQ